MHIEYHKFKKKTNIIKIYWVFYGGFIKEDNSNKKENSYEITIKIIIFSNKIYFYLQNLFLEFSIGSILI